MWCGFARLPLAFRLITTMISTSSAPAARNRADVSASPGRPTTAYSVRGPMYAITNRNITITAPGVDEHLGRGDELRREQKVIRTVSEPRFPISASAE